MNHHTDDQSDLPFRHALKLKLAQHLTELGDDELVAVLEENGVDTRAAVARTRAAIETGLETFYREQREQRVVALKSRRPKRARDFSKMAIEEVRKFYEQTIARLTAEQKLTMCFRGRPARALSDEEILEDLACLDILGVL